MTNPLAYWASSSVMQEKSFITMTTGGGSQAGSPCSRRRLGPFPESLGHVRRPGVTLIKRSLLAVADAAK
jgi:hypothetical protein